LIAVTKRGSPSGPGERSQYKRDNGYQILAAVAEAERERILERTNDGRIAALAAGVKFGRKKHPRTPTALELISQGESLSSVTEKTGISRSTYFRLKEQ
jgi:DNA invertase Pin-like site-specific DNA recombinase